MRCRCFYFVFRARLTRIFRMRHLYHLAANTQHIGETPRHQLPMRLDDSVCNRQLRLNTKFDSEICP